MSSKAFGSFIGMQNSPKIADPPAILDRYRRSLTVETETTLELGTPIDENSCDQPEPGLQTSATPIRQESSPELSDNAGLIHNFSNPPMNRWRMISCCMMCFGNGLSDSAPGALIPYMEKEYNIGYAVVSLIFITNALGFMTAAFFADYLQSHLGRAKSLILAIATMMLGYVLILCSPPFPVVVSSFLFFGLGQATNLALNNVFVANLANSTTTMGLFHGSYGIGGTVAPLIATAMVSHGIRWPYFYSISLGIAIFNLVFAAWSFWRYDREIPNRLLTLLDRTASRQAALSTHEPTKMQVLKQAIRNRVTILGALFIFAYQGAEVSISGWVISFLINYRGGDPYKVGYVTAGFWAGITVGRFVLTPVAHRIGERPLVFALIAGAMAFQLVVWLVPNIIGDAVAVAIVGLLLGPVYPCAMAIFARLVSRQVQISSLGFISAMGSSGGAVSPFTTGILAQAVGTYVLHPICIGLFLSMEICWFFLPKARKRTE